jgi:DNA-binding NarL/FixJ family response regulator
MLSDMTSEPRTRVLIAAGRPSTRSALRTLVELEPGVEPLAAVPDLAAAIRELRGRRPDVLLIERTLLGAPSMPRLVTLAREAPGVAIFVVGMGDHPWLEPHARRAGAAGYIQLDEASERIGSALVSRPAA